MIEVREVFRALETALSPEQDEAVRLRGNNRSNLDGFPRHARVVHPRGDVVLKLVDEPMVGLDPRSARLLKDLFRTFVENGGTVFLSTHTLEVAEVLCDRIAIINEGEIIALGSMDELRTQSEGGGVHLEEIFLKLTGGEAMADVIESLREAIRR